MNTAQERLSMLAAHAGNKSLKALAGQLGVNAQRLYDIKSGKVREISASLQNKIFLTFPDISPEWIRTGEGKMLKESKQPTRLEPITLTEEAMRLHLNMSETIHSQQETIQQLTDMLKQALGMRQATTPKKDIAG